MPLSEFYRSVNGKNESNQQKTTDISYIPNDEFVELIWEKGQVMMQGQSSKAKKTPVSSNFQFHTPKIQEKDGILDVQMPEIGLNQDDDMVPWLNYPLDDYCSDLLPEISGVTAHEHPIRNKDSHSLPHNVLLDQIKSSKSNNFFSWSHNQGNVPEPSRIRSGVSDIGSTNCRSKPHNVLVSSGKLEKTMQKPDSLPYSASTLLNFSHFSRPSAIVKANLQNNNNNGINHGPQKEIGFAGQPNLDSGSSGKVGSKSNPFASKPTEEPRCVEKSTGQPGCIEKPKGQPGCVEKSTGQPSCVEKSTNVVLDANVGVETEKSNEPIGASSSVCSGNSVERASNDLTKNSKRKSRDTEDYECQSQDVEEESLGTKTASTSRGGAGSKRSRAAEVHNLSERRRRDRINEKMRALQELIPNCNKVDKASMLDEAIEYLKTLQLQVQIMSMGTGLCMPPMMFPTGLHPAHVPHFSQMGMGMGMSYGMGMGMPDMNSGSPHMFSRPPNSGLETCQGIPRSSFYSQGMPMLFPQPPMPGFPMNSGVRQMGVQSEIQDVCPSSVDTNTMQNKNTHVMNQTQIPNQSQVANKNPNQVPVIDQKDKVQEAGCSTAGAE